MLNLPQGVALLELLAAQGLVEQMAARNVQVQELLEHVAAQNLQVAAHDVQLALLAAQALLALPAAHCLQVAAHCFQVPEQLLGSSPNYVSESIASSPRQFFYTTPRLTW